MVKDNDLSKTAVTDTLRTTWLGRPYLYFESVESTNVLLKEHLATADEAALPAGTVYLTDFQSAGRGRLARRWEAPACTSLLFSVLLRPGWPTQQANWLTMMASMAAADAIESLTELTVSVKWPNDLMLLSGHVWHKVGGILLEGDLGEDGRLRSVILGIGLNVNIPANQLPAAVTPATSLQVAGGRPLPRRPLLIALLSRLEAYYEAAGQGESPQPAWNRRLMMVGQPVQVTPTTGGEAISGIAEGTDPWGQLLVRDDTGVLHTIAAGDVTLRGQT